jgi:hypothetical protein
MRTLTAGFYKGAAEKKIKLFVLIFDIKLLSLKTHEIVVFMLS